MAIFSPEARERARKFNESEIRNRSYATSGRKKAGLVLAGLVAVGLLRSENIRESTSAIISPITSNAASGIGGVVGGAVVDHHHPHRLAPQAHRAAQQPRQQRGQGRLLIEGGDDHSDAQDSSVGRRCASLTRSDGTSRMAARARGCIGFAAAASCPE